MKDYYKILGLNKENSLQDIKKQYRKLSMEYHPDRNKDPNAEDKFKEINEAYSILNDNEKKYKYDMEFNMFQGFYMFQPFNNSDNTLNNPNLNDFDINNFNINDLMYNLNNKKTNHNVFEMFSNLNNFNSKLNSDTSNKNNLNNINPNNNSNKKNFNKSNLFNNFTLDNIINSLINDNNSLNSNLNSNSNAIEKPIFIEKYLNIDIKKAYYGCNEPVEIKRWILNGGIKTEETETIYVIIQEGIDDNEIIILKDKGHIINDNLKGDIKIHVKITNNTDFKRNGLDLIYLKKLSLKESLCGFSFDLEYINGNNFQLNNKKGNIIISNTTKVIKGMGMKRDEKKGDLIIKFLVENIKTLELDVVEKLEKIL